MGKASEYLRVSFGKTSKGFAEYLQLAGQEISKATAKSLARTATDEFLKLEDWDWPRGKRYDAVHESGRAVRGAMPYASGYRGGDAMRPWYSGNLHDSIAVGIMQGTKIMAQAFMPPGATSYQHYKGQTIDGVTEAQKALQRAAHTFAPGTAGDTVRAVMVIGVPYAEEVNQSATHAGYVEDLEERFDLAIATRVEWLRKIKLKLPDRLVR